MTVECAKMGKVPQGAARVVEMQVIVRWNECCDDVGLTVYGLLTLAY
jgi:hypothetical protein